MKKGLIALSAVAAMSTTSFAAKVTHDDMMKQIEMLKKQIQMLESKLTENKATVQENKSNLEALQSGIVSDKRFTKLEKTVKKNSKKIQVVKAHDAGDNIKWNVDFRTQVDNVQYKLGNGSKVKNEAIMSNRLWLGMKFKADENSTFYGTLSYNKLFGDNRAQIDDNSSGNNAGFDWVTNEAASNDNSLKVKEAYWLYSNDTFLGKDVSWTASVGRRPSTDGLGISLRADQKRKSALSHTVNVEFDGASARFNLDRVTGVEGMWLKFCVGRGLTNAKLRFSSDGLDYMKDNNTTDNVDMAGFIFVPWDNGQYSVHTNFAKAWNLIGNRNRDGDPSKADDNGKFYEFGDMHLATLMLKAEGIGDGINDFLDDTTVFASYAMSKTNPNGGDQMLGSSDSQTGHSIWLGANMPCPISDDARVGIEWNKGSKYWRSITYGEDTMAGSKLAARGQAWEIYRHQDLTKALSLTLRYTKIDYDYTGSNGFFGDMGTPVEISKVPTAVKEAQNITANIRYRY